MSIIMYDCGFGDCFCIRNEYVDRPLLVDFGIHTSSKIGNKSIMYMNVLGDLRHMVNEGGVDFLLTHYHTDHFSGLMHLIRKRKRCAALRHIRFENVYIPNVWNIKNSREIVMALLLSYLPSPGKRKMNIIDFLMAICQTDGSVHLINRGSMIGNELIALWPPNGLSPEKLFREINIMDERFLRLLSEMAGELIEVVLTMICNMENRDYPEAIHRMKMIKRRFYKLCQGVPPFNDNAELKLNTFGNEVSIVFHNIKEKSGRRNILFTGDVPSSAWNDMESLQLQDLIFLHREYGIIKVPHHGTKAYYYDFGKYVPDSRESKFLIPNGDMKKPGHEISLRYPNSLIGTFVCCSNNDNCEGKICCGQCICDPCQIVAYNPSFLIY